MMKTAYTRTTIATLLLTCLLLTPTTHAAKPIPNFSFVQITDNHVGPQTVGAPDPGPDARSIDTFKWVCQEITQLQKLEPLHLTAPKPAFLIDTGDITEYGVIHKTWQNFTNAFEGLEIPLYVTPGNHDNTWTSMSHIMRARHGGDHYSFDQFNCHFISFNSAGLQEPVPTIDQRTLTWLRNDLAKVSRDTPVFLFCHHPLSTTEYAEPYEQLRLLEVIGDHNIVLLMMGHGHILKHERWDMLDSVMGGETFRKHPGYNIISVINDTLHVVYRFKDSERGMQVVLSKPIQRQARPSLTIKPTTERLAVGNPVSIQAMLGYERDALSLADQSVELTASLDTADAVSMQSKSGVKADNMVSREFTAKLTTDDLLPGRHFVRVIAKVGDITLDRAIEVVLAAKDEKIDAKIIRLSAGIKGAPIVTDDGVIVATTDGSIERITFDGTPKAHNIAKLGVEILNAPALIDATLYVSAAEKGVVALNLEGKQQWACDVGAVVYGTPAVSEKFVYVGDLEGKVHAIERNTGKLVWSQQHASYSIEAGLTLHEDVLYFGAWGGWFYAVNVADGSLKWKDYGPAGHREKSSYKSRYYGPGDNSPLVLGDLIVMSDRAYVLGLYNVDGSWAQEISGGIASFGPTQDGDGFYSRGLEKGLTRYNSKGDIVWSNDITLGRFPVAPTAMNDRVYVCSNMGVLTVHDASNGRKLHTYRASPHLHVMAAVAVDEKGTAYVAGMDGTLTRVAFD